MEARLVLGFGTGKYQVEQQCREDGITFVTLKKLVKTRFVDHRYKAYKDLLHTLPQLVHLLTKAKTQKKEKTLLAKRLANVGNLSRLIISIDILEGARKFSLNLQDSSLLLCELKRHVDKLLDFYRVLIEGFTTREPLFCRPEKRLQIRFANFPTFSHHFEIVTHKQYRVKTAKGLKRLMLNDNKRYEDAYRKDDERVGLDWIIDDDTSSSESESDGHESVNAEDHAGIPFDITERK